MKEGSEKVLILVFFCLILPKRWIVGKEILFAKLKLTYSPTNLHKCIGHLIEKDTNFGLRIEIWKELIITLGNDSNSDESSIQLTSEDDSYCTFSIYFRVS